MLYEVDPRVGGSPWCWTVGQLSRFMEGKLPTRNDGAKDCAFLSSLKSCFPHMRSPLSLFLNFLYWHSFAILLIFPTVVWSFSPKYPHPSTLFVSKVPDNGNAVQSCYLCCLILCYRLGPVQ